SLGEHIASRDRSPDFTALGMYLPNPDPILKKMGKDAAVYRDLRSTAPVGGAIRRRKAAVRSREWRLVDSVNGQTGSRANQKASPRMMQIAQDTLSDLDMDAILGEMLDAPLFGWVPMEILWATVEGTLRPVSLMAKPQEWFHFDPNGALRFRSRAAPMYGEELQPRKFLVPRQDASYVNPYGFADLSMCFWPTTFMRGGLKFWVTFAEKFGTPWIVGKQPRSAGAKETDALLDQLEAMVQDAVAVVPDDSSVDIVEAGAKGDAAGAYRELLMFCRSEVNIALMGQNQTTEASANKASSVAGGEVERTLSDADAKLCEGAVNQVLRWLSDLNESEQAAAPRFELYLEDDVSEVQAKRDEAMSRSGVVFSSAYWERAYNLQPGDIASAGPGQVATPNSAAPPAPQPKPVVKEGDGKPADQVTDTPTDQLPEYAEGNAPRDAIDDLVDQELNQWQAAMDPLVNPLQAALDEALRNGETAAQLIARLPEVLDRMDPAALADSLTRASITARLAAAAGIPTADQA
ncbi:MAG: DUF935 domain-containing protein, partial [Hydrogenophaga sp.]